MIEQPNPLTSQEKQPEQEKDLSSLFEIVRKDWMANKIDYKDPAFAQVMKDVIAELPPEPTLEDISRQVRLKNQELLTKIDEDMEKAEEKSRQNRQPLLDRFIKGETPLLGEYFDQENPTNVCQQNVLLLAAVAATYDYLVDVAGFIYTGGSSGVDRVHAVALAKNEAGEEFVMDPTLSVPRYGDVSYLPKEEYLSRFINPRLTTPTTVFKPVSTN